MLPENYPAYLGLDPEWTRSEKAQIVLIPVPYDKTSTWIKGADRGPLAMLEASANLELYDIATDSELYRRHIHTSAPLVWDGSPEALADRVSERVAEILGRNQFPVLVGGEHSISIGAFRAFREAYPGLNILQLDAHADLRDRYEGSSFNHACVMARARELAPVLQAGIRSMSAEEKAGLEPGRIFFMEQIRKDPHWSDKLLDMLEGPVYLTFDLDVLDPSIMPSTGTPEPGGLFCDETIEFLKKLTARHRVVGFDVVELCPHPSGKAPDFLAAKLIYQLLSFIFEPHSS